MTESTATVLHIEDNEANRYVVRRILEKAGFEVFEATSGEAGLRAVAAHQPDLVVLDVKLPGMNGFEVCREIKSNPETAFIPVLHLSASFVKSQDKVQGLDSGADAYLAQPVEPVELVATARSLLRIRQAEEAALLLAREWQTTFNSMSDGIGLLDLEGRVLRCNPALSKLLGKPQSEIVGDAHHELLQATLGLGDGVCFRRTRETHDRQTTEIQSGCRCFLKTIDPVLDGQGNFTGAVFILSDITEQKQAEAAIRASEERFRLLLDNVQDYAIFFCDSQGSVTRWSVGAEQILGYQEVEILGRSSALFFTAEDLARGIDRQELERAAAEGRAEDDRWHVRKGGDRFWASGITTSLRDEMGQLRGFCKILRDITERKRVEDERAQLLVREQEARAASEAANRLKDDFLATLSHELRSPLNSILGWIRLLNSRSFDADTTARAMETIERNARTQAQLVEDLLDVSRIIQGKLRLNIGPINLAKVVEDAIETVRPSADAKDIQMQFMLDPAASRVNGDADRLQQVIWNLLSNAVKFTQRGGQIEIRLEPIESGQAGEKENSATQGARFPLAQPSDYPAAVQIAVTDNGQGIEPNFVPFVFDRFRQADSSITRTYNGLGLGLAIVRHLVELHGGTVHVSSKGLGLGSRFSVKLPLSPTQAEALRQDVTLLPVGRKTSPDAVPDLKGIRVLVVDDEADARNFLVIALETCGAIVTAVDSAHEAISTIAEAAIDVLISDIGMPDEDGYSLIRRVRALSETEGGTTPAIALTAYARAEDQSRALREGFHVHLSKPVDPAKLVTVVGNLMQKNAWYGATRSD